MDKFIERKYTVRDFIDTPLEELYDRMMLVSQIIRDESQEQANASLGVILAGLLEIHEIKYEIASQTFITLKELDYLCLS